jgi:biopolymer transport protein ExbB/TolQ
VPGPFRSPSLDSGSLAATPAASNAPEGVAARKPGRLRAKVRGDNVSSVMQDSYQRDRILHLGLLAFIFLVVHATYTVYVRPRAETWVEDQRALVAADPTYKPSGSLLVIIKDPEQESAIIGAFWALSLSFLKLWDVRRQRKPLSSGLIRVPAGIRVFVEDVREWSRQLENLPDDHRNTILPRVMQRALKRFGETGNIQDTSTTVHDFCETEASRLDSELAPIRFTVWAIPAIGFVGTVRGIGEALRGAQLAFEGDTSAVTGGLGISFNSTFVALTLSIFVMYVLHEVQLAQERLVLDSEQYVDEHLIEHLRESRS